MTHTEELEREIKRINPLVNRKSLHSKVRCGYNDYKGCFNFFELKAELKGYKEGITHAQKIDKEFIEELKEATKGLLFYRHEGKKIDIILEEIDKLCKEKGIKI